jgi:pyruvate carboxylase
MKMENVITAPFAGQIHEICIRLNELVQEGQLLFIIDKKVGEAEQGVLPADS